MTLVPNHVLYGALARERQARLLASASAPRGEGLVRPVRVRLGRMLISAGTLISGDSREGRARPAATRQVA